MASARRLAWAPRARRDLQDIWQYFARVGSPEIADGLLREIDRAGAGLKAMLSSDGRAMSWQQGCARFWCIRTLSSTGSAATLSRSRGCSINAATPARYARASETLKAGSHDRNAVLPPATPATRAPAADA